MIMISLMLAFIRFNCFQLQGPTVEVLCVDDGNREKVGLSRLRPLEKKFLKLPCQALCCALSGVRPVNPQQQKPGTYVT